MNLETILRLVAQLGVTATAAALFAWGAFRWFGKSWLETQFAQRLERFKHEQNQEIERLRFRINALMDRTAKLHQHEFEVLPGLWARIGDAVGSAQWVVSRMQTVPGLDRMNPEGLEEFFEEVGLTSRQRNELRALPSDQINDEYTKMRFWTRLMNAKNDSAELNNYMLSQGIFMQSDLKAKVKVLLSIIDAALQERELDQRNPQVGPGRFARADHFHTTGIALLNEIEADVQSRLWDANKLD